MFRLLLVFLLLSGLSPKVTAAAEFDSCFPDQSGLEVESNENIIKLYIKANEFYKDGKHGKAISCYEAAISAGMRNGDVYYNLGNSYFRDNRLGDAILNYKRAERFMPNNNDLEYNMAYALSMTKDQAEEERGILRIVTFQFMTDRVIFYFLALVNIIFWLSLFSKRLFVLRWSSFMFLLILLPVMVFRLWFLSDQAVITGRGDIAVKSSPSPEGVDLFIIHEGLFAAITGKENGFNKIKIGKHKRGWIEEENVEKIIKNMY